MNSITDANAGGAKTGEARAAAPDVFHLVVHAPASAGAHPRLWWLGAGLLLCAAALLWQTGGGDAWLKTALSGERSGTAEMLLPGGLWMAGGLILLRALFSHHFQLEAVDFSPSGLAFQWTHVPGLLGSPRAARSLLTWDQVKDLQWQESQPEHQFRQFLRLELAEPVAGSHRVFKLLVSEERDLDRCMALLAALPTRMPRPDWLSTVHHQRRVPDTAPLELPVV